MKKLIFVLFTVLLFSCNKDDDPKPEIVLNIANSDIELVHDQTKNIGATTNSGNDINYIVEDEHIATVENGKVTGVLIGETTIKVTDNVNTKTVNVVTKPKSNIFTEPYLGFGESLAQLENRFKNDDRKYISSGKGFYIDRGKYAHYYTFSDNSILTSCGILFKTTLLTPSDVTNFLNERYYLEAADTSNDAYLFESRDEKFNVYMELEPDITTIMYAPK